MNVGIYYRVASKSSSTSWFRSLAAARQGKQRLIQESKQCKYCKSKLRAKRYYIERIEVDRVLGGTRCKVYREARYPSGRIKWVLKKVTS